MLASGGSCALLEISHVSRYCVIAVEQCRSSIEFEIKGQLVMAQNDDDDMFEDNDQVTGGAASKPRKQKAGGGTNWGKVILILLGVGGISLALCCGVGYYFFQNALTQDPVKIAAMQKEIVEIDLPAGLQPAMGMNMNFGVMTMTMAMYNPNQTTSLMLMQMQLSGQTEEQMQQAFSQQAGQQQQNAQFKMESSETKTIKVDGQDRNFIFAKGTISPPSGTATPVRMVTGMFPSKNGMGFIQYSIDETTYDEAAVIKTIESIHK